jgi:hypothetical protein
MYYGKNHAGCSIIRTRDCRAELSAHQSIGGTALIELDSHPTRRGHDLIIWRDELQQRLGGVSTKTLKRYIDGGKVPPPDVRISLKRVGWKSSTLIRAGLEALCY